MGATTHTPITYLSLLQKYGGNIKAAHSKELRAAANAVPQGENCLTALFAAVQEYKRGLEEQFSSSGVAPAVCINRDDHCDDDHCRCWK